MEHASESYEELLYGKPSGMPYSDDDLRAKFREGLSKLEGNGDYDVLECSLGDGDKETVLVVIWKALHKAGVEPDDLTGIQLLRLRKIIGYDQQGGF